MVIRSFIISKIPRIIDLKTRFSSFLITEHAIRADNRFLRARFKLRTKYK